MEVDVWVFAATCLIIACVVLYTWHERVRSNVQLCAVLVLVVPFVWLYLIIDDKVNSCFEQLQRTSQNIKEALESVIIAISPTIEEALFWLFVIAHGLWLMIYYVIVWTIKLSTHFIKVSIIFAPMWLPIVFAEA